MFNLGIAFILGLFANAVVVGTDVRVAEPRSGGQLVATENITANVRVEGAGPSVVLLHGFGAAMDWWDELTPGLSRTHTVVSIDLIGHGGSEAPLRGYEIENQAAMVAGVLAQLGVTRTAVVGHSMGGEVATALATAHPALVTRLVLIDTPTSSGVSFDKSIRALSTPIVGEALHDFISERLIRKMLASAFATGFDIPQSFVDDFRQLTYSSTTQAHAQSEAYRGASPTDVRLTELPGRQPVLIIMGSVDEVVGQGDASAYRAAGFRVEIIEGAGHSPIVEKPQETLALVLNFL